MIVALTGATGTGKSHLAIALAKKINGEIINADAFQVYEKLTIATAAPTLEMKREVPHHLFAFVPLSEGYDIARYQLDARRVIAEVMSRHHVPLLVGGSGLYLRSALYDYDLTIDTSHVDLSPYEAMDDQALWSSLSQLDAVEANKISPHNRRRLLRSLAICLASGTSKTSLLSKQNHAPIFPTCFFALKEERETLYAHLDARVEEMFRNGLLDETLPLIKQYGEQAPAFQAIGVKELFPYLHHEATLEETTAAIQLDTRHYVKRQETFFRHQFPIQYINGVEDILVALKHE